MNVRLYVTTLLGFAIATWAALLWIRGVPISWDLFWPFGLVVSLLVTIVGIFEKWAWSWRLFRGWFVRRPDLRGTWRVVLESEWGEPGVHGSSDPIVGFMAVRQTLLTLSMRLMTAESSSWLIAHKVVPSNDGVFQVAGVYTNKPQLHLRGNRSEMHYGAILLDVHGEPPTELEGHYWTDRNSRGSMRLTDRKPQVLETHASAKRAFGDEPPSK